MDKIGFLSLGHNFMLIPCLVHNTGDEIYKTINCMFIYTFHTEYNFMW